MHIASQSRSSLPVPVGGFGHARTEQTSKGRPMAILGRLGESRARKVLKLRDILSTLRKRYCGWVSRFARTVSGRPSEKTPVSRDQ
jgi:hypothetical protein